MISLFEIAKSINEVDDEKIIKYKKKDGESGEMKAGSAKTLEKDHPAKIAWDKMQDDGEDDSEKEKEKPSGKKLGGGDFDRDSDGDDGDDGDDLQADEKADNENKVIADKLDNWFNPKRKGIYQSYNLSTSESEMDGGMVHSVTRGDDDPENELVVSANPSEDQTGVEYQIGIGSGGQAMYFDSRDEMMNALEVFMNDRKMKNAMDGEGDDTLLDLGSYAKEALEKDKKNETVKEAGTKSIDGKELMNFLMKRFKYSKQQAIATMKKHNMDLSFLKEGESETNPKKFKEIYDRTFRSLK